MTNKRNLFEGRQKILVVTVALVLTGLSIFTWINLRYGESIRIERYVESFPDSELPSLAPVTAYLEIPLERGDFADFAKRVEFVVAVAEGSNVRFDIRSALSLFDADVPALDCGIFHLEPNRKACQDRNDLLLSVVSSSHCGKSECVIDHALLRAEWQNGDGTEKTPESRCSDIPSSLAIACERASAEYSRYQTDSGAFVRDDLEKILRSEDMNEVERAVRRAVLENPDSPVSECSSLSGTKDRERCESLTKELFSYVGLRNLRKRFERIENALNRARNPATTAPENPKR